MKRNLYPVRNVFLLHIGGLEFFFIFSHQTVKLHLYLQFLRLYGLFHWH